MHSIRLTLLALLVALPSLASAQSVNFEQATTLLGTSCAKDIDDYCRGVNLDTARLKECFSRNSDSISPQCKSDYPRAIVAIEQRVAARIGLMKLCNWEMNHLCGEDRGDPAKGLQCLIASKKNTPNCNKAIDAAGYR
jgi:hypothetical protein